jgi:stringent starvation protein B
LPYVEVIENLRDVFVPVTRVVGLHARETGATLVRLRLRHKHTQKHKHKQRHRDTDTHRDTHIQRDTETQRHRDTETQRQTHIHPLTLSP